jgi:hypothetical protein
MAVLRRSGKKAISNACSISSAHRLILAAIGVPSARMKAKGILVVVAIRALARRRTAA